MVLQFIEIKHDNIRSIIIHNRTFFYTDDLCSTPFHESTQLCFWRSTEGKVFYEALAQCKEEGGTLALLNSQDLVDFAHANLPLRSVTWAEKHVLAQVPNQSQG